MHHRSAEVLGVSQAVVKNLIPFEHVKRKSLRYAGFEISVESLENTFIAEVLERHRPVADGGECLTIWFRRFFGL